MLTVLKWKEVSLVPVQMDLQETGHIVKVGIFVTDIGGLSTSFKSKLYAVCHGNINYKSYEKKNTNAITFPFSTKTRLIRHLLYGFWFSFTSVFSALFVFRCCRLPYVLTSELVGFASCLHPL